MATIPASAIVSINPGVLSASGNDLQLLGIEVTHSRRVPVGSVASYPSAAAVAAVFGAGSLQAANATVYFNGYTNKTAVPQALLFAQWVAGGVGAWLQSGNISVLGLAAIQALSGTLSLVVDGYTYSAGALNLSSATSFSSAATLIATALNASLPAGGSVTGAIAPSTSAFTGGIAGSVLTVSAVASGLVVPGTIVAGTGVTAYTTVLSQLSGTANGVGTYAVSITQSVPAGSSLTGAYGTLTVSAVGSGTLSVGQTLSYSGVTAPTKILGLGTGAGGTGTYYVNPSQTASSTTITSTGSALAVTFDSVSGGFLVKSGSVGSGSTIAYATGSLSASLLMTALTSAVISQGAFAQLPGDFMNAIVAQTQNWATFFTDFDPDNLAGNGQKQLFAAWVNSTNDRFAYVCWDTDPAPTLSASASTSLGAILAASQSNGTILVWEPSDLSHAAFVCGMIASVNYSATNGQIPYFGRSQAGLVASVSNQTVAANLDANGYNYVGAYATANQQFVFFNKGQISGSFAWANTYMNQIWLGAQFQVALMTFLTTINSVPYNEPGNALIEGACAGVIAAALNCGVVVPGITLSAAEVQTVNQSAGVNVAPAIQAQGFYFQILPSSPSTRQARSSPPINFWYTDGGSVQQISLNSIDVQ